MTIEENHIILKINSILNEFDNEIEKFKNDLKDINNFSDTKFFERKDKVEKLMTDAYLLIHTYKSLKYQLNDK